MKVYNNDSIFSSNDPAPTPAEPSPAPKVDILQRAREYGKQARKTSEDIAPDLHAQYRALVETDPRAAGQFWRDNYAEIIKQYKK